MRVLLQNYKLQVACLLVGTAALTVYLVERASEIPMRQAHAGLIVRAKLDVITGLNDLMADVTDAETGQRGFLLTGDERYLKPYDEALQAIYTDEQKIAHMLDDDAPQKNRLTVLSGTIESKIDELKRTVELKKQSKLHEAMKILLSNDGQQYMESIREQMDAIKAAEQVEVVASTATWHEFVNGAQQKLLVGVSVVGALVGIILLMLYREIERRRQANAQQQSAMMRLEKIVDIQRELANHHFDLEHAMRVITERTEVLTAAKGAIVEFLEGDEMVYKSASGTGAQHLGLRIKAHSSLSGLCVATNRSLRCDDAETDIRVDRAACRKVGLRSMVVVPLHRAGRTVGVIKVMSPEVSVFSDNDVSTLELLATVLSAVISDAQASQMVQSMNANLSSANMSLVAQQDDLKRANAKLEILASTDGLTGIRNRRAFSEILEAEVRRHKRYQTPVSLIIIDVDAFKSFNDTYGHPAGDVVLRDVAKLIEKATRDTDFVARYGGEEFAVLMPETSLKDAGLTAERIRAGIESADWQHRKITVSLGVSTALADTTKPSDLLDVADKALYQSKANGRNQVTIADENTPAGPAAGASNVIAIQA